MFFERIRTQEKKAQYYEQIITIFNENMTKFLKLPMKNKEDLDKNIIQIKKIMIELYPKTSFTNDSNRNDSLIIDMFKIMKEILEKDIEEIGIKVKAYLNECCRERTFQLSSFKTILEFINHSLRNIHEIYKKNMERDSSKENVMSNCSFKIISDLTSYSAFFYQNFISSTEQKNQQINLKDITRNDIEDYKRNVKNLLINFIQKQNYTKEQSHYFEDYLVLLCKGICCYFFFKRIRQDILQVSDLIKTIKYILENTSMKDTYKKCL